MGRETIAPSVNRESQGRSREYLGLGRAISIAMIHMDHMAARRNNHGVFSRFTGNYNDTGVEFLINHLPNNDKDPEVIVTAEGEALPVRARLIVTASDQVEIYTYAGTPRDTRLYVQEQVGKIGQYQTFGVPIPVDGLSAEGFNNMLLDVKRGIRKNPDNI